MKNLRSSIGAKIIFFLAAGLFTGTTLAQELPQPSPFSKIEQVVGLTDITIEYSRPGVKDRTIFGDLVPYNEVWRLGANACTKFTCSTDIMIDGQPLVAGTYAVFAFPSEKEWKIVFNTDIEQWGAGNYDESKNVVTVQVKTNENTFHETFTISINNVLTNAATLSFEWAKIKVNLQINIATIKIAQKRIDAAIEKGEDLDKVYYKAASYYYKTLKDETKALEYVSKGIKVNDSSFSLYFLKAQIFHKQGEKEEALKAGQKALELSKENKGWYDYIQETLDTWK